MNDSNLNVTALLTCHNRKVKTLACIEGLLAQELDLDWTLHLIVVDDGSTDGTVDAIHANFPQVEVIQGSGDLYWNGGMRAAWAAALAHAPITPRYFLWVNDDLVLLRGALRTLLACAEQVRGTANQPVIAVGNIKSSSGVQSYGAVEFPYVFRRLTPRFIYSDVGACQAESMNGNLVAISSEAYRLVGDLDPVYIHTMADFDYGLRAHRIGIPIVVPPGYLGVCDRNSIDGTHFDPSRTLAQRWRQVVGPKGRPPRIWLRYCREYAGPLWLPLWFWPYIRTVLLSLAPNKLQQKPIASRSE
jgi:GT2 family glycosyltransferase